MDNYNLIKRKDGRASALNDSAVRESLQNDLPFYKTDVEQAKKYFDITGEVANGGIIQSALINMPKEEQKKFAQTFSEGSKEYETLLLNLWGEGIETKAGCSGIAEAHKSELSFFQKIKNYIKPKHGRRLDSKIADGMIFSPYCSLPLTPENKIKIASILNCIPQEDATENIDCMIKIDNENIENSFIRFGRFIGGAVSEQEADLFFSKINNAFEKAKENGFTSETSIVSHKEKFDAIKLAKKQSEQGKI